VGTLRSFVQSLIITSAHPTIYSKALADEVEVVSPDDGYLLDGKVRLFATEKFLLKVKQNHY